MFVKNKNGIAYQGRNPGSHTVVDHEREPQQQPRSIGYVLLVAMSFYGQCR
jgi:hypothetical protein